MWGNRIVAMNLGDTPSAFFSSSTLSVAWNGLLPGLHNLIEQIDNINAQHKEQLMGSQDSGAQRAAVSVTILFFNELLKIVDGLALSDACQIQAFEISLLLCKIVHVLCTQCELPVYLNIAEEGDDFISVQLKSKYNDILISMKGGPPPAPREAEFPFLTDSNFTDAYGHLSFSQLVASSLDYKKTDNDSFALYCSDTTSPQFPRASSHEAQGKYGSLPRSDGISWLDMKSPGKRNYITDVHQHLKRVEAIVVPSDPADESDHPTLSAVAHYRSPMSQTIPQRLLLAQTSPFWAYHFVKTRGGGHQSNPEFFLPHITSGEPAFPFESSMDAFTLPQLKCYQLLASLGAGLFAPLISRATQVTYSIRSSLMTSSFGANSSNPFMALSAFSGNAMKSETTQEATPFRKVLQHHSDSSPYPPYLHTSIK